MRDMNLEDPGDHLEVQRATLENLIMLRDQIRELRLVLVIWTTSVAVLLTIIAARGH